MATAQSILIDAIRRIAGIDPDTLALLRQIQKRGGIDGIKTELGGDGGTGAEADCCSDPGKPGRPGNPGGGGGPWTDCETGQPVTFDPNGFPQPETCKGDCERPDPTWEAGYYWTAVADYPGAGQGQAAGLDGAVQKAMQNLILAYDRPYSYRYSASEGGSYIYADYIDANGQQQTVTFPVYQNKTSCSTTPSEYCTDEAPIISDCQDWTPDNTTSYTLVNGCIVASSCDPDAGEQAKQCNECITICNEDGEEHVICAGPDNSYLDNGLYGGWSGYY